MFDLKITCNGQKEEIIKLKKDLLRNMNEKVLYIAGDTFIIINTNSSFKNEVMFYLKSYNVSIV